MFFGTAHGGRVVYAAGYTGLATPWPQNLWLKALDRAGIGFDS